MTNLRPTVYMDEYSCPFSSFHDDLAIEIRKEFCKQRSLRYSVSGFADHAHLTYCAKEAARNTYENNLNFVEEMPLGCRFKTLMIKVIGKETNPLIILDHLFNDPPQTESAVVAFSEMEHIFGHGTSNSYVGVGIYGTEYYKIVVIAIMEY